jgi:hypothetical protein
MQDRNVFFEPNSSNMDNGFSQVLGIATETTGGNMASEIGVLSSHAVESNSSPKNVGIRTIQAKRNEKKSVKSKFIFTNPFMGSAKLKKQNVNALNTHFRNNKKVTYKVGDIVEGVVIINKRTSEPPNFLVVDIGDAMLEIGFGGRAGSVIEPYKENTTTQPATKTEEVKTTEVETTTPDASKEKAPSESEGWSTKKKVIVGVSAVAVLGAIFGLLKWKKII